MRAAVLFLCVLISSTSAGQIRLSKLVLKQGEVYELKNSDILVVDTLIMMDSSRIILDKMQIESFIHAKAAIFHRGAIIDGKGIQGLPGRPGRSGRTSSSPCAEGVRGLLGTEGTRGGPGKNLSLYMKFVDIRGSLTIDVSGGDAGDGGTGGDGGGGGPGTRICQGGNGGQGGDGADGGNGGNAGSLTFHSPHIMEIRSELGGKIIVRNYGGNHGLGGEGGSGGYSGLSPVGNNKMDGKPGRKGLKGKDGVAGKTGIINFEEK